MPRYVILLHETPDESPRPTHWDLMLEAHGKLRTWALETPLANRRSCVALPLADHRLAYLDWEGELSKGRGRVRRWDAGTYEIRAESDEAIHLICRGNVLQGRLSLTRTAAQRWLAEFVAEAADKTAS